ncbi:MAG: Fic family protein [Candidatus Nanopelagicales bacterium]
MTEFLTTEDGVQIVEMLGQQVRDLGLLASAINRPSASAFGEDAYPSLGEKIAALIDGINRNHPLIDGNKRLSWICARNFANLNGHELRADPDDGEQVIFGVAEGSMDFASLTVWTNAHLSPTPI